MRLSRLWRRNQRADLDEIETDANKRLAAARAEAASGSVTTEQTQHLRQVSQRLARENQIAKLIRDGFV